MSIRKLVVLVTALGLLALGSASAPAATTLRTHPGGALLSGPATIRSTSGETTTFITLAGIVACTQSSFDASVSSIGGTVSGTLTSLTFTGCEDEILGFGFNECHLHGAPPPSVSIVANSALGGTVTFGHTVLRCAVNDTQACYFTAPSIVGTERNLPSTVNFPNTVMTNTAPTSDALLPATRCFAAIGGVSGTLAVKFTHIVTASNATVTVTTS